jgi:excisionase family DNA binding protein
LILWIKHINVETTPDKRSPIANMQKRLITIKEASEYLGIIVNTLYSWVSQKKIDYVKIGRLTKFDLRVFDKFIENNSVEAVN